MTSLPGLWRAVFPGARLVAGGDPLLDRHVSWVRLMRQTVPAFDALAPGDLVIMPGAVVSRLADDPSEAEALLDALDRAHCSAVIAIAPTSQTTADPRLEQVLAQRTTAGLAVFLLGSATDPASLERAIIGYLINARAELDRQAGVLEASIERLALLGEGLDALVAAVAAFLARPVALEGPRGEVLALHAAVDLPEAPAAAAAYLGRRRGSAALRTPLPGGAGTLVLLGEEPVSELARVVCERIGGLLALQVGTPPAASGSQRRRARPVVGEALPSAGPPWTVLVARQLQADPPASVEERQLLRERLRALAPATRLVLRGDVTSLDLRAVAATAADDPMGTLFAARAAELLDRPVAVSRPFSDPDERAIADAESRSALDAWQALHGADPQRARVVRADLQPVYQLLHGLRAVPDGRALAETLLRPLSAGRGRSATIRLETLQSILDHPGQAEAARALGIHRNTLSHRIAGIESLTGWSLDDPELRLALLVALRLVGTPPQPTVIVRTLL